MTGEQVFARLDRMATDEDKAYHALLASNKVTKECLMALLPQRKQVRGTPPMRDPYSRR